MTTTTTICTNEDGEYAPLETSVNRTKPVPKTREDMEFEIEYLGAQIDDLKDQVTDLGS